jgi:hypothetical protein
MPKLIWVKGYLAPELAWGGGLSLFIVTGVILYALRADDIALFIYLLVFTIALTATARGSLQNFGLTATVVLAFFLIATTIIAAREPRLVSTAYSLDNPRGDLFGRRPIVGWGVTAPGRYRSKHVINGRLIYDAIYTINDALLRKVDSGVSGKGTAFVGDSFIFGDGLQDGETLPQQFADLEGRKAPVYNLGFSAYSPAQALAEMRAGLYDTQLKNSRVIVEFVAPWQAERVTCKSPFVLDAPRFLKVDGNVVQKGRCPSSPLNYFSIYRYLQSFVPVVTDNDIDIFTAVTQAVVRLAREKYKVPVVIYYLRVPKYFNRLHDWNDDKVLNSLRAVGAEILEYDIPPDPKYRIRGDGHPTRFENALCARKLIDFLRKKYPDIETAATSQHVL